MLPLAVSIVTYAEVEFMVIYSTENSAAAGKLSAGVPC